MFLGTYEYSVDPKGRLFIPSKLRESKGSKSLAYILTRGLERCLYLYDKKDFQDVIDKLGSVPIKNQQDGRAFKRVLLAGAQDVALDNMGRILLPRTLMEYADIKKDVAILGVGERIELWASKHWEIYSQKAAGTFQRLGKHLEV